MQPQKTPCRDGRHLPNRARTSIDPAIGDPSLPHTHCYRCGHLLVKSPITHRWRPTGMMG